jgi:UDP-2,3-diacylglucosamine pyrophosphatase LpxH
MMTSVTEERLAITSDIHLGNLLFRSRRPFLDFLGRLADDGYSVCINGDGIDLAQLSVARLTRDIAKLAAVLRRFAAAGSRVHYVVGNHDIVLEHFLHDWGVVNVVPFLNVQSGSARIRVEHGHLYDAMFVRHPVLYHGLTLFGGWCLTINPLIYHTVARVGDRLASFGGRFAGDRESSVIRQADRIPGEHPSFLAAAREIAERGFDAIVFGHTHLSGQTALPDGARYYNTGSWFYKPHYVDVREGSLRLLTVDEFDSESTVVVEPAVEIHPEYSMPLPVGSSRD